MDFHWSFIELDKSGLVVCENIGTLPITLTRHGDLSGMAFVGIEAHDRTTRANDDYRPNPAKQVQFDPGETDILFLACHWMRILYDWLRVCLHACARVY